MRPFVALVSAILIAILFEMSFFSDVQDPTNQIDDKITLAAVQHANLPFIENQDQMDDKIKYYAKTFAGTVYVTDSNLIYQTSKSQDDLQTTLIINEKFLGKQLRPQGNVKSASVVSYFKGSQENWKTNIPTYDYVSLGRVWDNVDVDLKAHGNNMEKIFTVHPGGNPADIKMSFDGISDLNISDKQELTVSTEIGDVFLSKPIGYQLIGGSRHYVPIQYEILNTKTYGFSVLSYDPSYDLVIDPLIASTFIGGGDVDFGNAITRDSSGNVYITGVTKDAVNDLPVTAGVFNTTNAGLKDVFVSKFNSALTTLSASTFIGGSANDQAQAIALDSSGNVYITGQTQSDTTIFPTTAGAYSRTFNGTGTDAFVSKFNSALTTLSASTLIGGTGTDIGYGIAVSSSGGIYVTGRTDDDSTDFPVTTGAYDLTHNGSSDAFVSKFNSTMGLTASTLIGGAAADEAYAIVLDSSSNPYITGYASFSAVTSFPTTAGVFNQTNSGGKDAFVSKFNSALSSLSISTFIGGNAADEAYAIVLVDSSATALYITGYTADGTTDFPVTTGAYDTTQNGNKDAFVSKFSHSLTTLDASTFIGGSDDDFGNAIVLDASNDVYITGDTADGTTDFPVTTGAYDTTQNGNNDAFVSKFNSALSSLSKSTFIGGSADDFGNAIVLSSSNDVYITGDTADGTTDFPVTTGAYDTTQNGNNDAYVSNLDCNLSASGTSCGTLNSGGSVSISVASGGTASVTLPSSSTLTVKLPAGNSGTITVNDTNSGTSDSRISFFGSIVNIVPSNGASCSGGCTISFTFTGSQASAAGYSPSQVTIFHDKNEDGNFQSNEAISTTVTGSDPYTATANESFTSKFAVGGIRANAVAAASSLGGGGFFGFLSKCDPDGFSSGHSLKVYEITYDKCTANKLQVLAYSTCGPIKAEVTTGSGRYTLGMSSVQPFLNDDEKKIVLGAEIDSSLQSFNILIKDKRDDFTDKIRLDQCNATKLYSRQTGYTSQQQSSFVYDSNDDIIQMIQDTVIDPEPDQSTSSELTVVTKHTQIESETTTPKSTNVLSTKHVLSESKPIVMQVDPEPTEVDPEPIDPHKTNLVSKMFETLSKLFQRRY